MQMDEEEDDSFQQSWFYDIHLTFMNNVIFLVSTENIENHGPAKIKNYVPNQKASSKK